VPVEPNHHVRRRGSDAGVHRRPRSAARPRDQAHGDAGMMAQPLTDDLGRRVGRLVIDNQNLGWRQGLNRKSIKKRAD